MWLVITLSTNARQKPWFNTRSVHLERYVRYVFHQPHLVCSFPSQLIRLAKILIPYTASYQDKKKNKNWLVVSTPLKNMKVSWDNNPIYYGKIKHVPNHQSGKLLIILIVTAYQRQKPRSVRSLGMEYSQRTPDG